VLETGFRIEDDLDRNHWVPWCDIVEFQAYRVSGDLEFHIRYTLAGRREYVLVTDGMGFYRRRLGRAAAAHLPGFDEAALKDALASKDDGLWLCFSASSQPAPPEANDQAGA
jgi:hypothetical protein